jgi:uncharacterized Fe-S cluster protein YjdI
MENDRVFSGGRKYSNGEITVYWKPNSCVHASYCYRELIEVFDPSRRPWVDIFGASTEQIIETVNMCPTDALTWKWDDEEKNNSIDIAQTNHVNFRRPELIGSTKENEEENPVSVKIMPDGPLVITGTFTVYYSGNKKEVNESIISLCRCGASIHLPFCDGMHRKITFDDK